MLRLLHIAASLAHEISDQVVHITANVACLTEFSGIGLHERDADEFGRRSDEVRLTHARGTQQQDILLLIKGGIDPFLGHTHMLKMVAQRHAENLLGLGLTDDKAVEMPRDFSGLEFESETFGWGSHLGDSRLGPGFLLGPDRTTAGSGRTLGDGAEGIGMTGRDLGHGEQQLSCSSSSEVHDGANP